MRARLLLLLLLPVLVLVLVLVPPLVLAGAWSIARRSAASLIPGRPQADWICPLQNCQIVVASALPRELFQAACWRWRCPACSSDLSPYHHRDRPVVVTLDLWSPLPVRSCSTACWRCWCCWRCPACSSTPCAVQPGRHQGRRKARGMADRGTHGVEQAKESARHGR